MAIAGFDGYLKRVNPSCERILGWRTEELLGRPYLEFVHPEDRQRVLTELDKLVTGEEVADCEICLLCKDEDHRWFLFSATPVLEDGLIYAVGVDITERKRVEEATGRLASIVECSTDAIIGLNLEGTVISWNPAAEKLLGYPAAEMLGQEVQALTPPGREREFRAHLRRVLSGEPVQLWETERLRNDGVPISVSISLSLIRDAAGVPVGLSTILRDLTERERYEREHRIAQILQASLLPQELPRIPGMKMAARYLPGAPGAEVGGDWYDVIRFGDDKVILVIGDVVGKGVSAAATSGQLRSTVRTFALEGLAPATALDRLNRVVFNLREGEFSTLIYLTFHPTRGLVCFARAGHPPPLLVRPDRTTAYLEKGGSVSVGVVPDAVYEEANVTLEPGLMLLLYTDGVVESRRRGLDVGLKRLACVAAAAPVGLDEFLDHVLDEVPDEPSEDDIALLAFASDPT